MKSKSYKKEKKTGGELDRKGNGSDPEKEDFFLSLREYLFGLANQEQR